MEDLITFEEALKILDISHPTLYKLLKEKKIDGYLLAGKWKFKRQHLEDYVERCRNLKDVEKENIEDRR